MPDRIINEEPFVEGSPDAVHKLRYLPFVLMVIAGTTLSLTIFAAMRDWEWRQIRTDFDVAAHARSSAVATAVAENRHILNAIHGLYSVVREVRRAEFQEYVQPFCACDRHPGVGVGPAIPNRHRDEYEAAARRDGLAEFQFTEKDHSGRMVRASPRAEYFPAYFVEPRRGNEAVVGFDLGSSLRRRKAIEEARDSGNPAIVARIALAHKPEERLGLLILLPVYKAWLPIDTVPRHRENLRGFVLGVFRMPDVVKEALQHVPPESIDIHFFDADGAEG